MKTFTRIFLLLLATCTAQMAFGQKAANTNAPQERSVFIVPANEKEYKEYRDPFFPESTRLSDAQAATHVVETSVLTIKGISGTPGNLMVIINNHTFGVGDEGDVLTSSGRVHIRCLEITSQNVIVEANGQRRVLNIE